ncbi:PhoH-like protein [Oxobacter pfennigii]|uniref:PhoH-like protein n=1 Tax=Oxobacter pfennigii TaxID=36849 RepID=A0A0P8W482_9CLOT|nr:PhoH family protein [Oxobacter pfennigii]KPU43394.1 PhoH-like protein [Oxobacter pfennigii]
MIKNFIIDTNVMIHDPNFLQNFEDNNIIIPIICIEELDNLKKKGDLVGYHARSAAREINKLRELGSLHEGVKLENGGSLRIEINHMNTSILPDGMDVSKNDSKILAITKNLQNEYRNMPTVLVTKDLYMSIKGDALGIEVQDYKNDKVITEELYKGYTEILLPSSDIDEIYKEGLALPKELDEPIYPNEFLHIKSSTGMKHEILARYDGKKIVPLKYLNDTAWGLSPINREQKMAFELLMDPSLDFVSITGGAGSGKTILSTAVALQKVIEMGVYRKIVFVRPVVAAGNDIGFLPGTEDEKLRPWMGSFYDAIENLMNNKYTRKEKEKQPRLRHNHNDDHHSMEFYVDDFIDMYKQQGAIETKTFTYMRGRTLSDAMVIVDEAQEITPHLAKLMLTRAGFGSKFVFLGDPSDNQIDNVLVDAKSNGLVYTVEKMKPFNITGHVALKRVERSPLAEIAEKFM